MIAAGKKLSEPLGIDYQEQAVRSADETRAGKSDARFHHDLRP